MWVLLALWSLTGISVLSAAESDDAVPRLHRPAFPKEPNKRPAAPLDTTKFVEAPDEPPHELNSERSLRVYSKSGEWDGEIDLGWFYQSLHNEHHFSGTTTLPATRTGDRRNANALSLAGNMNLAAPGAPLVFGVSAQGTMGRADGLGENDLAVKADVQDFKLAGGLRFRPTGRSWQHDLRLGADIQYSYSNDLTIVDLTTNGMTFEVLNVLSVVPRLNYRYAPRANWSAEIEGSFGIPISTSSIGDRTASEFRRIEGEAQIVRYVVSGGAFGLGVKYVYEKSTWTGIVPIPLTDTMTSYETRLRLFWRTNL